MKHMLNHNEQNNLFVKLLLLCARVQFCGTIFTKALFAICTLSIVGLKPVNAQGSFSGSQISTKNFSNLTKAKSLSATLKRKVSNTFNLENSPVQLYLENFGTTSLATKPYTGNTVNLNSHLSSPSWTTSASGFGNSSGSSGKSLSLAGFTGSATFTLTFNVTPGYELNISSFDFWYQRSVTGPLNWTMAINGISIGSGIVPSVSALLGQTNVTNTVTGLTGAANLVITFSSALGGTCGIDDFTLYGTVTPIQYIYNNGWIPSSPIGIATSVNPIAVTAGTASITSNTACSKLDIAAGAVLEITPGQTFTVNDTISGDGTISGSATSNLTAGSNLGTIKFTPGANTIQQLVIGTGNDASLTLGRDLNIAPNGGIGFNALGTKSLNTNSFALTLKSAAGGTAYVANTNGATITGNITIERFVASRAVKRWRFAGSPFSKVNFGDLQNEIYITGEGVGCTVGTLNSNGFDATASNKPSVYAYNETMPGNLDIGWEALRNNTSSLNNQPIVAGKGYRIFIRGDRSDTSRLTTRNDQNSVTLNLTGAINIGDFSFSLTNSGITADDGWNFLGNPYPCSYNWKSFWDAGGNRNNIGSAIWIYDPSHNAYKAYNANSSGDLTDGIIPMFSSFWVQATGSDPSLTFKEQFKTGSMPLALFKNNDDGKLKLSMKLDSNNKDCWMMGNYENSTTGFDIYDTKKIMSEINIASINSSIWCSFDARPSIFENDTVSLTITPGDKKYTLEVDELPRASGKIYLLYDVKLKSLNKLSQNFAYIFSTSASDSSTFANRFKVIITNDEEKTGIDNLSFSDNSYFKLVPNPANDWIEVQSIDKFERVIVTGINGKQILETMQTGFSIAALNSGIYFVKVVNKTGETVMQKLIKN
jgi:hypothetical protein